MKRFVIHIVLSIVVVCPLISQSSGPDSLPAPVRLPAAERERAIAFMEISRGFLDSIPDTALHYANRAELILQKSDPGNRLPLLFKLKGQIYERMMLTDRSLQYYRRAFDEFIRTENHMEIGRVAEALGHVYYELADFGEAYFFYMQSLNAFERNNDRMGIARMQINLGQVSREMGKLKEAENHFQEAYEIYIRVGSQADQAKALNYIGLVLYDNRLADSALQFFRRSAELLSGTVDIPAEEADRVLARTFDYSALAYAELEEYDMALRYLRRGLDLAVSSGDPYQIGSVYNNFGSIYRETGQQDSALYFLHRSLRIAGDHGYRQLELEAYRGLARLHYSVGNYASAYNWHLRYDTVYKALFNENQSDQIARLRARYEQEIKDREIEQLHSESQIQRMLNKVFIAFIAVIIVLGVIIMLNIRSLKRANRLLEKRNSQVTQAMEKLSSSEKELQSLNRSKDRIFSVVAHDLRNPVAAVHGFSDLLYENFEQFSSETQKQYLLQIVQGTQRIQDLLENMLIWARAQMQSTKFEPEALQMRTEAEDCIKSLKANLDHKNIRCTVRVDRKCVAFADRAMIQAVLRNLVMNAVKFSFPGGRITLSSTTEGDRCSVHVTDQGIGIQPEIQEKLFDADAAVSTPGTAGESGSGLGLLICRDFVERNRGEISVESEPGNGSTFTIRLPANGQED